MDLAVMVIIIACGAATAKAQTCAPPTCFVNGTREISCNTCPVGSGVVVQDKELMLCRSSPTPRNTKCESCVAGVNFSDTNDSVSKCSKCSTCHSVKEEESKECTPDSNRECICKRGLYYYDDGLSSCMDCRTCREDQEERRPCTPTENRECGNKSAPPVVTTTPVPPTTNQTTQNSSPYTTGNGMSPDKHTASGNSRWWIALIVIPVLLIIFIVTAVRKYRTGACTRQNSDGSGLCILNCCIGNQTNRYDNGHATTPHHNTNGHASRDPETEYHQVSNSSTGSELNQNGTVRENSQGTTSSIIEMESQQSVQDTLDFSPGTIERLIRGLENDEDPLQRNIHMFAERYLHEHMSPDDCNMLTNSSTPTLDVLRMWKQRGKNKAEFIEALRDMGRDDMANICEEDSSGS